MITRHTMQYDESLMMMMTSHTIQFDDDENTIQYDDDEAHYLV